jgi:hypothetical protein
VIAVEDFSSGSFLTLAAEPQPALHASRFAFAKHDITANLPSRVEGGFRAGVPSRRRARLESIRPRAFARPSAMSPGCSERTSGPQLGQRRLFALRAPW